MKKIISMDVFDTAITRKVYLPEDLFELIEDKVGNSFKQKRIEAEIQARNENPTYGIDGIYKFLPEFDKGIEIQTEILNCIVNNRGKEIYDYYKDKKDYEIIFISDMYLPSKIIELMLFSCGYENPKVFVSCEEKAHKGDGSLFEVVKKKIGLIYTHYGDNYTADILGARKARTPAKYVPAVQHLKTSIPNLKNKLLQKLLVLNEQSNKDLNSKVAYYFAPLIYNFTRWVLNERDKHGENTKIFFNARDGYLPYLMAKYIFKAKNIFYISASRKSVLFSSIDFNKPITHKNNELQLNRLLIQRVNTFEGFLKTINYTKDDLVKANNLYDFIVKNQSKLYKHFENNQNNAVKYFSNFNIQDGDMLVDVGYYGTIQFAIEKICGVKLKGYYLQTFKDYKLNLERYSYFPREVVKYCLLIETLFSSSEDGINGYDDGGNPIHYKDNKQKKEFSDMVGKEIIKAAKYLHANGITCSLDDIEKLTIRFLYYPTLEESHYCNEPIFENGDIVNTESVVWYNRDQIKEGKLQDCYNKSYWRPAFLKLLQNDKELCYLEKFLEKEDG